jgi:hypothetical protein
MAAPRRSASSQSGLNDAIGEIDALAVGHVDVRADLRALEAEILNAATQLGDGELGRLHRQCAEADEALGILGDCLGEVVVEVLGEVEAVLGLRPVGEHDWHGGKHLHVDVVARRSR